MLQSTYAGLIAAIVTAIMPSLSSADYEPELELSGFGTLGYSISDSSSAEYRLGDALDGVDRSGSFLLDTRLGFQLDGYLNEQLSATVQVVARDDERGDFSPELEWAFLKWRANDTWTVRLGRMSLPTFNVSDFREVGYANVWLRPPEDVYVQVPIRRFNGIDLAGNFEVRDALVSTQLLYGQTSEDIQNGITADADNLAGVNVAISQGVARFRVSYVQTKIAAENDEIGLLSQTLEQLLPSIPSLESVANIVTTAPRDINFASVSLELEFERFFVDSEYTWLNSDAFIPDTNGWYVTAGYRYGNFTPYVFTSQLRRSSNAVSLDDIPAIPTLEPLVEVLSDVFQNPNQRTTGIGVRWDFHENLAFKSQLEIIQRDDIGLSFFRDDVQSSDTGGDVTLLSVVVDYIF